MINGRKETSFDKSVKTDQVSDEWIQLIPNFQKATDLNSSIQTNDTSHESSNTHTCNVPGETGPNTLTRTKTLQELSERENPLSLILGNCRDIKQVTYAECPTLNSRCASKDNEHLCECLDVERSQDEVAKNDDLKRGEKTASVVQKKDEEIQTKGEEKLCEIKDRR